MKQERKKRVKITLCSYKLHTKIDAGTWKRMDATLGEKSDREQSAVASDTEEETTDAFLINDYLNRRDAKIRARLKFCLVSEQADEMEYSNDDDEVETYVYIMELDSDTTKDDLTAIGRALDEYLVRGATYDWYLHMGYDPIDSEAAIAEAEERAVSLARGKAWGAKPVAPFGPALFDYNKVY